MTCLECKKELSYMDHRKAIELFDVELCEAHRARMERLVKSQNAPAEAIILYYALKKAGVKAMLAWWDGKGPLTWPFHASGSILRSTGGRNPSLMNR